MTSRSTNYATNNMYSISANELGTLMKPVKFVDLEVIFILNTVHCKQIGRLRMAIFGI